jgi:hypothetical protein
VRGTAARASGAAPRSASAVLGSDHPLARATDALDSVVRQSLAVAAVLVGSIIDLLAGRTWAATLSASAAIVLVGLTVIATACKQRQRDRALALILEGRENVPVAAVQRQRSATGPADANHACPKPRGHDRASVDPPRTPSVQDLSAVRPCCRQGSRGRSSRRHPTARLRPRAGAWGRGRRAPAHRRLLAAVRKSSRAATGRAPPDRPPSHPITVHGGGTNHSTRGDGKACASSRVAGRPYSPPWALRPKGGDELRPELRWFPSGS